MHSKLGLFPHLQWCTIWEFWGEVLGCEGDEAAVTPSCQLLWTAPSESCSGAQCCQNSPSRREQWYETTPWWQSVKNIVWGWNPEITKQLWSARCYLLKSFCYGGDGGHSTGDSRYHVTFRPHRAVEVPLLWVNRICRFIVNHSKSFTQALAEWIFLTTASRTMILATWSGGQTPEVSAINLVSRG